MYTLIIIGKGDDITEKYGTDNSMTEKDIQQIFTCGIRLRKTYIYIEIIRTLHICYLRSEMIRDFSHSLRNSIIVLKYSIS
jgi:hypothetical protein